MLSFTWFQRQQTDWRHFKTDFRGGEAPAEPRFGAIPARREPRPPGLETGSSVSELWRVQLR